MQESIEIKQDEFRVGDVVWDVAYGKGKVVSLDNDEQPVKVAYDSGDYNWYTQDGKLGHEMNRTLFFSEPKIEASVTRPFVPTLVGKRVVVKTKTDYVTVETIYAETANELHTSNDGDFWRKSDLEAIYEVSSENLLK